MITLGHSTLSTDALSSLVFGGALVGIYFWSRFDESSYESQTEYFARYQPRFSTSHTQYRITKSFYILLILAFYIIISGLGMSSLGAEALSTVAPPHVINFLEKLVGKCGPNEIGAGFPLLVALLMVTFRDVPPLRALERRSRGILHALAHIPEDVRRTVGQMRSSEFRFDDAAVAAQIQKIKSYGHGVSREQGDINSDIRDDELLQEWCRLGCVLYALSEQHRTRSGIDEVFFEKYKDEFKNINDEHCFLLHAMGERVDEKSSSSGFRWAGDYYAQVSRMVNNLRDRLYTFVACGVRSSLKTDIECVDSLKRLGFDVQHVRANYNFVWPITMWSLGAIAVVAVIATVVTEMFCSWLGCSIYTTWIKFPIPDPQQPDGNLVRIFLSTWATAAFYFAATLGALLVRIARIDRREWFDINDIKRNIPFTNYPTAVMAGTITGCVTLYIISLFGPDFRRNPLNDLGTALREAFPALLWFPLAILMAVIALWLMDADVSIDPKRPRRWQRLKKFLVRAAIGATIMAVVGGLVGWLFMHEHGSQDTMLLIYTSIFLAFQIGLFAFILSIVVQILMFSFERGGRLAGRYMQAVCPQGPGFIILLDCDGGASWFAADEKEFSVANVRGHGQWTQFPEGTVVHWVDKLYVGSNCGDLALISSSRGYQIYEGPNGRISGAAEFDARLNPLAVAHNTRA